MNAIDVKNLTKTYRLYKSHRDRLMEAFYFSRRKFYKEFDALKDISFSIGTGETVGVIGQNGSGKSTLLKIICGVSQPTSGSVITKGRISSLLELGAGFHPEFSGRENIYMNGVLMGFSREEMEGKLPKVEEFAEIGEYIEQPVKSYSSGMFVRLAFAVAINVDPDILIIDEALAVGDIFFQAKCMIHMKKMIDNGITLVFVSHDLKTINSLCKKCAFLENGHLVDFGEAPKVVSGYVKKVYLNLNEELKAEYENVNNSFEINGNEEKDKKYMSSKLTRSEEIFVSTSKEINFPKTANRYGDGGVKILDIKLLNSQRRPTTQIRLRENFFIQVSIRFGKAFPTFAFGYNIKDLNGINLIGTVTTCQDMELPCVNPGDVYVFEIQSTNMLTQGIYTLSIGVELPVIVNNKHIILDSIENAIIFNSYFPPNPRDHIHVMVCVPAEIEYLKI